MRGKLLLAFLSVGLAGQVQQTYQKAQGFDADFVQKTYVEILDKTVVEKGHLRLARGGSFSVTYTGAHPREFISDGKKLKVRDGGMTETYNLKDSLSREALSFLSGLGEMKKQFRVTAPGGNRLELIPRDPHSPFSKILLTVNEQSLVQGVRLFPKNGNRSEYQFSNMRIR